MQRLKKINMDICFVDRMPSMEMMKERCLYICIPCRVIIHKCACGCGRQVVTPLSPRGWTMKYNGQAVSLSPSIGNWAFPCQSHYWITDNSVVWANVAPEKKASRYNRFVNRICAFFGLNQRDR